MCVFSAIICKKIFNSGFSKIIIAEHSLTRVMYHKYLLTAAEITLWAAKFGSTVCIIISLALLSLHKCQQQSPPCFVHHWSRSAFCLRNNQCTLKNKEVSRYMCSSYKSCRLILQADTNRHNKLRVTEEKGNP